MNPLNFKQLRYLAAPLLLTAGMATYAQVPVDDRGEPLADYEPLTAAPVTGNEDIPLLSDAELEELVGPIALYPDDLLAIVLPASTYPLQLVQAQRFLEDLEDDPSLEPDEDWDDSVVALLNYPEILELLNQDLDWTWRLGEAVVAQQPDVVSAVETFRDRAYAAGNLKSDEHQTVARTEGTLEITPVDDDIIYVPYYEPEEVVVYQPRRVYYYYPRAYPVYYYPYPSSYAFHRGYFWGVTTAFTVGWLTDSLHVYHHSYYGHPYYAHHYWDGWWYRRPSIHVHNTIYVNNRVTTSTHRYRRGDYWRPRYDHRRRLTDQRIARSRYYSSGSDRRYTDTSRRRSVPSTRRDAGDRVRVRAESVPRSRTRPERSTDTRPMRETTAPVSRERPATRDSRRDARDVITRRDVTTRRSNVRNETRRSNVRNETRRETPALPVRERRQTPPRQQRDTRPAPQRQERAARQAPPRERQARRADNDSRDRGTSRASTRRDSSGSTNRSRRQRN